MIGGDITSERIVLTMPAEQRYRRLVRLLATGLAPRAGPEQVEGLRAAVDRSLDALLETAADGSQLRVRIQVAGEVLSFQGDVDDTSASIDFTIPMATKAGANEGGAGSKR